MMPPAAVERIGPVASGTCVFIDGDAIMRAGERPDEPKIGAILPQIWCDLGRWRAMPLDCPQINGAARATAKARVWKTGSECVCSTARPGACRLRRKARSIIYARATSLPPSKTPRQRCPEPVSGHGGASASIVYPLSR